MGLRTMPHGSLICPLYPRVKSPSYTAQICGHIWIIGRLANAGHVALESRDSRSSPILKGASCTRRGHGGPVAERSHLPHSYLLV